MSNIELIIEERAADIGNFMVGRLLPFRKKRMVGPFAFIDHMGPTVLKADENLDVAPHPHIGLSTLTFLFEGSVKHRDSLGTEIEINPGAVNWMTAGRGIVHSERTPERLRGKEKSIHGLQIWVALPLELEQCEPSFTHIAADELPQWKKGNANVKLIAGKAFGKISPVPVHSALYFIEIKSTQREIIDIGGELFGESGLYILEGKVQSEGHKFGPKQILVTKEASLCSFEMEANTTLYIFGGEPFAEPRHIYWNFIASDMALIDSAKKRWREGAFPQVPGEVDFVPLPS